MVTESRKSVQGIKHGFPDAGGDAREPVRLGDVASWHQKRSSDREVVSAKGFYARGGHSSLTTVRRIAPSTASARVRTGRPAAAVSQFIDDRFAQHADLRDLNLDHVARLHEQRQRTLDADGDDDPPGSKGTADLGLRF
jgi:hypothetical protein